MRILMQRAVVMLRNGKKIFLSGCCFALLFGLSCEEATTPPPPASTPPAETSGTNIEQGKFLPSGAVAKSVGESPSVRLANVVFHPKGSDPVPLTVAMSQTPEEKKQALEERTSLPEGQGLWLIFEEDVRDPLLVNNTPISLDILFVDEDYEVVEIVADTFPYSDTPIISPQKYRHIFAVRGGWAADFGVAVGDGVEYRMGPP